MEHRIWNKKESLTLPSGRILNAAKVIEEFPFSEHMPVLLELTGEITGAIDPLPVARATYSIEPDISDQEAVREIDRIRNAPPPEIPPEKQPITKGDMQLLEQHLTDLELTILEANANV